MRNRFKNKDKVFVYGTGKNAGVFYRNVPAIIIERDSFYKDYLVKFNDGSEDWIEPNHYENHSNEDTKNTEKERNQEKKRKKGVKGYEDKLY